MLSRRIVALSFAVLSTVACAAQTGGTDPAGPASEDDLTQGDPMICTGLGTNDLTIVQVNGKKVTITVQGGSTQTGTLGTGADPGFSSFASWTPAKGFMSDTSSLWLSADGTKVQMHDTQYSPVWQGSCHKASPAELSADPCEPLIRDIGFISATHSANVTKVSDTSYKATYPDAHAGDFVWSVKTTRSGILCKLGAMTPVTCSAIVADAIAKKARDDGSSSGEPYVNKKAAGEYNGGIHDEESGEFAYDVVTSSSADGCKVTSITARK
jgi:hypothetical protein